jgi:hypothetical protein
MGRINDGALGSVDGKVGNLVFSSWKGQSTVRSKGRRSKKAPTPEQEEQREKFRMVSRLINSMTNLLLVTYKSLARRMSGSNAAFAETIKECITGTYPSLEINYQKVIVAEGSLANAGTPAATASGSGNIDFTWNDNSGIANALATDQAILVAYSEELGMTDYIIGAGSRSAGTAALNASRLSGKVVHTWISFINAKKQVATSYYTGVVTVL